MKTRTQNELIIEKIAELSAEGRTGGMVLVRDLRPALNFKITDKKIFDQAVLRLSREMKVCLYEHDYPSSLSEDERGKLVTDGDGSYYNAVSLR